VIVAPFFIGVGETERSVGTTVSISPAGIDTPLFVIRVISPSVAVAGTTNDRDLPSSLIVKSSAVSSAPFSFTAAIWLRLTPVMVIVCPAFGVSLLTLLVVGRLIVIASSDSNSVGVSARSVRMNFPDFASAGIAT
jgi:hypothetical protein